MCLIQKWTKWERSEREGTKTPIGIIYPKRIRGIPIECTIVTQTRGCTKCGLQQEKLISPI